MPNVNPSVLTWARETAGLSLTDAARALGLSGKRRSPEEKLAAFEAGEPVSRPQLLKMVRVYRRPLLVFYLDKPPAAAPRGEDFRTLPAERAKESAAEVEVLVRDVHVRQRLVKAALEDAEEAVLHPFVGSATLRMKVDELAQQITEALRFDLGYFRSRRTVEDAFSYLRGSVERMGVFVLLIGNLGSHHSNISPEVFRGFALADDVAPFAVINDQDAKTAWSFTLLHELVHVWLGQTGISGGYSENRVEQFCNNVASQVLLPAEELKSWKTAFDSIDDLVQQISAYAGERKLSRSLVTYRLLLASRIDHSTWQQTSTVLREMWLKEREQRRIGGKPSYYVVRRHRVGGALLDFVRRSLEEGVLTPTKAGRVLGVKATNVEPLLESA
jgi:Zn-dependent peptidase ImmA (M78 family)